MAAKIKGRLSFRGGVHPPERKGITCESAIQAGPAVKEVAIMLSQHIGAPCRAVVEKGAEVEAGQKVGDCDAFVCAPVHSPIAGKVKEIGLRSHAVLGRTLAVVISAEAETSPVQPAWELKGDFDASAYSSGQICEAIREGGLVGMGGAGFPTRVKIEPNPQKPNETMIINGCECEPYITCDYRMMLERTNQIVAGVKLAKAASGCSRAIFAIEDNKPAAIEAVSTALRGSNDIEMAVVKTKYPQGGERQLINSVLRKRVPTGGIPPMIGVVVLNVATTAAIADAVVNKRPLTHRVVTVSGEAIARPGNYYVAIGTLAGDLIEFCGGVTRQSAKVIMGGPMMGLAIADLDTPLTKTSGAITVLTKEQIGKAKFKRQQTACIRCGRCLAVCPENLNPTKIAHAVKSNLLELAQSYYLNACMECGCCSYVCPANIELTGYIKTGKIFVARQKKRMPQ
ncbi:MAG: electron transport complex subunit RsxC [Sedimentisphaerales bacterium]|nr:electron transport complex subunit RsxC [Sedimentisphaerales bacterium]